MRTLSKTAFWSWTLGLAALMEAAAVVCRFGLGWTSTETTAGIVAPLTIGIRIHHGYFGVLLLPAAYLLRRTRPAWAQRLLVMAAALILSDLFHHFLVLWPVTGSPQWDWVYL